MCYPVCGVVDIKEPLLLIEVDAHVAAGDSSLAVWVPAGTRNRPMSTP